MKTLNRRRFLGGAITSAVLLPEALAQTGQPTTAANGTPTLTDPQSAAPPSSASPIDFRFAPVLRQTAICFPDDPHKTLVNERGDLLYDYRDSFFHLRFSFTLGGMQPIKVLSQQLESPSIPILTTVLEQADARMILTTFATNDPAEGRVDNVLLEVHPRHQQEFQVSPIMLIQTAQPFEMTKDGTSLVASNKANDILFVARVFDNPTEGRIRGSSFLTDLGGNQQLTLHAGLASSAHPYRAFFRFPQAGQGKDKITAGLTSPEQHIKATRAFWSQWAPFHQPVQWNLPERQGEFLVACARNILQAREVKDAKLTFQVGASCYRGLWVVDGNFILESARYLGYDKDAIEGLKTTWTKQLPTGQIVAGGGTEHYKDTAIAMFTLVRQCELSQDWTVLKELEPHVVAGIEFLDGLRARARREGSTLGGYGLLPRGFADGGLEGVRDELTNTLWVLAGLKAIGAAGESLQLPNLAKATHLHNELFAAFNEAARREMRSFDGKFDYLPMVVKSDPQWALPDPWDRPRPQCAQWALSHTIFPGRVFDPAHPVVQGHVALMQAVKREGIPCETGWNHHESIWGYNAAFVAEVYLWLGMKQAAHDTFIGFLNHASPNFCWREEQPLQGSLVGTYVGDMPHNWASAECIRFLRHMFALEDGTNLRLLAGVTEGELAMQKPYTLTATPTKFGRLDLNFEPLDRQQGWRLSFRRGDGPVPDSIVVPEMLGRRFHLNKAEGVALNRAGDAVKIDPKARQWSLVWKA